MEMLKKAQSLDTSDLLIQLNLAHTYMFLNNIAMAKAIHEQFKNQNISANQTWVNKAINDLDYFKKINLNTSNFKKILRVLE
jgi:predicted Zn-dependent protease